MTARMKKAVAELRAVADNTEGKPLSEAMKKRLRREWPELAQAIENVLRAAA